MKRIIITEEQAMMLNKSLKKKKVKLTNQQLKTIVESIGGDNVTKQFNKSFSNYTPKPKFESEGQLNEGLTVDLLELTQQLIMFIIDVLTDESQQGLDSFWRDLGVTRGELLSLISDSGLLTYGFFKLAYSEKIKKVIEIAKELYQDIKDSNRTEESTGASSSGAYVGAFSVSNNQNDDDLVPSREIKKIVTDDEQIGEMTSASANATYDAPGFAKTKIGSKAGHMKQNFDIYDDKVNENLENLVSTSWPDGAFVEFDNCVKLNNNKVAQNGGCSTGDSGVVKLKKTKGSVISKKP